jgi:rRNA-processing protein FCF1
VKTRPSIQILLDTSFLITMLKQHRDPQEEIRAELPGNVKILVLDLVLFELERLARKGSAKSHAFASASLDFLEKRKFPVVEHKPGPSDVDAALIACSLSEREPTGIATVDRPLRSALASQDVPVIYPRTRRGLVASKFHF